MMGKFRVPAFIILSAAASTVHAQRYFFENVGVRNGLPASKVYALLQDSSGLIWVGTETGLASYDGNLVKIYGAGNNVAPNGSRSLFLDSRQRLWSGHLGGGISLKDGHQFRRLTLAGTPPSQDVTAIAEERGGAIWLATFGDGAFRITDVPAEGEVPAKRYGSAEGLGNHLVGITTLNDGSLLFVEAQGGLKRWDDARSRFVPMEMKGLPSLMGITTAFQDRQDRLWIGTQSAGAVMVDPRTGRSTTYDIASALPSNFVMCFAEDEAGRIWIGTWDNGLARIEPNGMRRFNMGNGTHSQRMRCIFRDREGNLLIGTHDAGLDVYKGDRFRSFTEEDHLVDRQVWAVLQAGDGSIWLGTNGGVAILSVGEDGASKVRHLTMQGGQLTSNHVRALVEDRRSHIWIGTEDGGLFDFDRTSYRPGNTMEVAALIAENKVTALAIGAAGELWVGTINGLIRSAPGEVPTILHANDGIGGDYITALYMDREGQLWVGSLGGGVARMKDGQAHAVDLGGAVSVSCLVQDAKGRLWVGTEGRGIMVVDGGRVVKEYSVDDGLASNSIHSLVTDMNGHVWIGTNRGLNEWIPDQERFMLYTARSGFTGIEAKPSAAILARNGDLWFGTANGAIVVAPQHGDEQETPPTVAIRGLKINLEDRPLGQDMELGHAESNLRIEYGSVSLSDPDAVRYQYRMEGLDQDWQPLTEEQNVHYPSLPPGQYVFKVRAMGRSGLFTPKPAEMRFTILPPWYRRWWAYTLLGIFLISGTASYVKVRERQLRMRNLVLERKVEERTAEVRAQSREIEGQKVRIEELLLNILPKPVSDELSDTGKATARRFDEVTVMFTDMKGFTTIAEKLTPEQLVAELHECFVRFDRITARFGIEKIKTIGDSYMSACGLPTKVEGHALRAVMAALEVREDMERWHRERQGSGKPAWVLRIGLHSGAVVAGVVGQRKFAYDIWGDAVNTASRMESSGAPGEVNVSGTTYALIQAYFHCEHRGQVEAKNKGRIDMYFVRRLKEGFCTDEAGLEPNARFLAAMGMQVA